MTISGIEQGRADFAYKKVQDAIGTLSGKQAKEYKAYVKKIPMMIKTNGLGATFAFMLSKGKYFDIQNRKFNAYGLIYAQVDEWFTSHRAYLLGDNQVDGDSLANKFVSLNSAPYRAATVEVLALFNWLRRFAEGLIEGNADD